MDYIKDPKAIYQASFATIEAEANLARFDGPAKAMAVRTIHACGMVDLADDLVISNVDALAGVQALRQGAAIITDVEMVASGIIRSILPADNLVICGLREQGLDTRAARLQTTRSAAGIDLLKTALRGSVVVIGNAPTALFRLLEMLDEGAPRPAMILGFPVGFVGAVESKQALIDNPRGVAFASLKGRRGGSAIAAAALNALAGYEG